ncbi:discoidin domain-containing protein [Rubellicoccus peritrichatus]|uniref:beta-galactosidase n=1 Tax=Rubellicoccus peritrichatus TaxID=3080537 RepID=A0AAQ3L9W6_9BACT|nr:discoidin domain-containing protein [Puniceicoccus sp. CR14]WOO40629.1 discoidin domain-containing protein [Puniceicoccus sp. CR14]
MRNVLIAMLALFVSANAFSQESDFQRPEYAPEYIPPGATGDAKSKVSSDGATSLDGTWNLRLEHGYQDGQGWFEASDYGDKIDLPGAVQNAGFGEEVRADTWWTGASGEALYKADKYEKYRQPGNIKVPFFLQPERRFFGHAWYQQDISFEDAPKDKDLILTLERTHWSSKVWLDGKLIGYNDSLAVPHVYNLGSNFSEGEHSLVIKIENNLILPVGGRALSVADDTQGPWNGIIGEIDLHWQNKIHIESVKVYPDYKTKTAKLKYVIQNDTSEQQKAELTINGNSASLALEAGANSYESTVQFGPDAQLWNEFTPVLHPVTITLKSKYGSEVEELQVGLRNIEADGKKFMVNGEETFMRGVIDCAIFPVTGYPPMDKESWLVHLKKMQDSGINHVRFHSWCPPRACFEAADELGMYLMPEAGIWGDPANEQFGTWVEDECKRIIDEYGNHPSFVFFTHGNESWHTQEIVDFLVQLTINLKEYDNRMLHTASANGTGTPSENDDFTCNAYPRGTPGWKGVGFRSPWDNPIIQHEPGQWCVYPNFDEMVKYTGPLKPKNFEIILEMAEENGVLPQWRDFLYASGQLQMLCYKEDCEAALASEDIAGTQLLSIYDFPGQGTSLVGYLDAFMDEKGYFTKEQFTKFWNWSVPLARLRSYEYKSSDVLQAPIIYFYYGPEELKDQTLLWEIVDETGKQYLKGEFSNLDIERGRNKIGEISQPLSSLPAPNMYTLRLSLKDTSIDNHWDFFVYENDPVIDQGDVLIADEVDSEVEAALATGKSVLLFPKSFSYASPRLSFQPVFWNKLLFSHLKDRETLGILVEGEHPIFNSFPTKNHSHWNWEYILENTHSLVMQELPQEGNIVQPIDDWNQNRRLGMIAEYNVGPGKLVVCMADLLEKQEKHPAAKQLLGSILKYMNGPDFQPKSSISLETLSDSLQYSDNKSVLMSLGATVPKIHHQWNDSQYFHIDGNSGTRWEAHFNDGAGWTIIDLKSEKTLQGLTLTNTNIKEFEVFMGNDIDNLQQVTLEDKNHNPQSSLTLPEEDMNTNKAQKIAFKGEAKGQFLKLYIKSIYGHHIKLGELDIIFVIK